MRRSIYLYGLSFLLISVLGIFPIACSKTYTFSPTSPFANNSTNTPTATSTLIGPTSTPTPGGVTVITLAGSTGVMGSTNATGTAALFNNPTGVAVDASGNVYVADKGNNLIRKITSGGVVTTFAGGGPGFSTNGTGTGASFDYPYGVTVDSSGNVYVADDWFSLIRMITSGGVVSTMAGSGTTGSSNGTGTAASFSGPTGVAVDSSGNVYVADEGNDLIREITSLDVVTTLAGSGTAGSANGTGTLASFHVPDGVALDSSGNIYVADADNNMIRKITLGAVVTILAGSGALGSANGTGNGASFNYPTGVAVDNVGNVYIADYYNNLIRKITAGGVVSTLAGQAGVAGFANGTGTAALFNGPFGVAVDTSGNVYVADEGNDLIREIIP